MPVGWRNPSELFLPEGLVYLVWDVSAAAAGLSFTIDSFLIG